MKQYDKNDNIFPTELEEKYNCVTIETIKISSLMLADYPNNVEMFDFFNVLNNIGESEVSIYISKQDKMEILKKLTSVIASSKEEIISTHDNRVDSEVLDNNIAIAKMIRHSIQVDNEDVYKISIYMTIWATNIEKLKARQKEIINYLYTKQIVVKPANFRQKEIYLQSLPLNMGRHIKENYISKLVTSNTLSILFPFYTNNIFEKGGIIIGKSYSKLCVYNIFSETHSNYNMSIIGGSGSGKSYLVKLMILRNKYKGIKQIIFDPEGEYVQLVKLVGGKIIRPENYNLLYIEENFVNKNYKDFLLLKTNIIIEQLKELNLLEQNEIEILEEKILKVYLDNEIDGNIDNMYKSIDNNVIYIQKKYMEYKDFPTISNVVSEIASDKGIKVVQRKRIEEILKKIECENIDTSINSNDLLLYDLSNCTTEKFKLYMNIFFNGIKEHKDENTIIYIDEIWKCVSFGSDENLTTKIFNMFKTLRKEKMGIVSITQDVSDFFTYQGGLFGKSILNNSYNKLIFNLQYIDVEEIAKIVNQTKEQINRIKTYERGRAFVQMGNSNFELVVEASKWEHDLIEGRLNDENNANSN